MATAFLWRAEAELPWSFWVLYPYFIAWVYTFVAACRHRHYLKAKESVIQLANAKIWTLYLFGEPVPLTVWMTSGSLLMVAGLVSRFGVTTVIFSLSDPS